MNFEFYYIKGNLDKDVLHMEGYYKPSKRYFKVSINIVDTLYDSKDEQYILVKYNNKLYCIETTLINNPLISIVSTKIPLKNFNYLNYNIPVNVYMTMIGSIVSDI